MHKDVLITIVDSHLERIRNGEILTQHELMELLDAQAKWVFSEYKDMVHLYKDQRSTIRIYDLFLSNKGLDGEFDNFHHRIIKRKFKK
jgi:hypothetical protein